LNFFLYINRKFIILFGAIIIFLFLIIIFYKQINLNNIILENTINSTFNADISEPKFAINNDSKKIYITASQGNFINKDEVLLNKNVRFKSNDFSIETEKVIFNRDKQTAKSKTKSMFKSKNATITSDGFNIHDKGNKIIFYGNSYIILK
jgi:LPS export ABC transporter protein LptC